MPKHPSTIQMGVIGPESFGAKSSGSASKPTVISGGTGAGGKKLRFGTQVLSSNILGKSTATVTAAAKRTKDSSARAVLEKQKIEAANAERKSNSTMFNKGFGQHILKNPLVVNAIVEKANIRPTDVVIEIGPGTGNLTEKLLMAAKKVIAFEVDPRMVAELHKRFQHSPLYSKLEIVRGDCLEKDFPYFDRCVANCPYAISSALVFKLLKHKPAFKTAVLMFQREFALRVCAPPGTELYGRLGVNSQLLARCSHLMKISKNSFVPPPKVESSVIRLDPKSPPPPIDFEEWDGLVKLLFNRKNKKASSIFRTKTAIEHLRELYDTHRALDAHVDAKMNQKAAVAKMSPDEFKVLLSGIIDGEEALLERRARSFTIDEITQLLGKFNSSGIHFA